MAQFIRQFLFLLFVIALFGCAKESSVEPTNIGELSPDASVYSPDTYCGREDVDKIYVCGEYVQVVSNRMGEGSHWFKSPSTQIDCPVISLDYMSKECKDLMLEMCTEYKCPVTEVSSDSEAVDVAKAAVSALPDFKNYRGREIKVIKSETLRCPGCFNMELQFYLDADMTSSVTRRGIVSLSLMDYKVTKQEYSSEVMLILAEKDCEGRVVDTSVGCNQDEEVFCDIIGSTARVCCVEKDEFGY